MQSLRPHKAARSLPDVTAGPSFAGEPNRGTVTSDSTAIAVSIPHAGELLGACRVRECSASFFLLTTHSKSDSLYAHVLPERSWKGAVQLCGIAWLGVSEREPATSDYLSADFRCNVNSGHGQIMDVETSYSEFISCDRTGRRNAVPDIKDEAASVGAGELTKDMSEMTLKPEEGECSAEAPPPVADGPGSKDAQAAGNTS
ncbi:cAMP-dependent protein kinase inhibitor gamma isoform X1 [Arapaima gigas]